jgi:hypothetical protein
MERGSVGAARPPNLTADETIGNEGATVLGARGGVLLEELGGNRRCREWHESHALRNSAERARPRRLQAS